MKKTMLLAVCLILAGLLAVNGTFAFSMTEVVGDLFATLTDWFTGEPAKPYEGGGFEVGIAYVDVEGNKLTNTTPPQLLPGGTVERRIAVHNSSTADGEASKSAYFRIAFAVQKEIAGQLTFSINETDYVWKQFPNTIRIGNADYQLVVATYLDALPVGVTSPAALQSVTLKADTTSEQISSVTSEWLQVQVLAVNAADFSNIEVADGLNRVQTVLDKALPIDSNDFNPFE